MLLLLSLFGCFSANAGDASNQECTAIPVPVSNPKKAVAGEAIPAGWEVKGSMMSASGIAFALICRPAS